MQGSLAGVQSIRPPEKSKPILNPRCWLVKKKARMRERQCVLQKELDLPQTILH